MACCGRTVPRVATAMSARGDRGPVLFEYTGGGSLTMFGRATGRRYHFPSRGARVYVDGRDAPVLSVTQGLDLVADVAAGAHA